MNTALLIIDIQNDYFPGGKMTLFNAEQACLNAGKILNKFRLEKLPIVHIQHIAVKPNATFFLSNTFGAEIHKNVSPLANEKLIVKHHPNSFFETELHAYLHKQNITNLVICGMMTHMCIDATARAAKDLGFSVIIIGDACATKRLTLNDKTVSATDVQLSFLAALQSTYASVLQTTDFL